MKSDNGCIHGFVGFCEDCEHDKDHRDLSRLRGQREQWIEMRDGVKQLILELEENAATKAVARRLRAIFDVPEGAACVSQLRAENKRLRGTLESIAGGTCSQHCGLQARNAQKEGE